MTYLESIIYFIKDLGKISAIIFSVALLVFGFIGFISLSGHLLISSKKYLSLGLILVSLLVIVLSGGTLVYLIKN